MEKSLEAHYTPSNEGTKCPEGFRLILILSCRLAKTRNAEREDCQAFCYVQRYNAYYICVFFSVKFSTFSGRISVDSCLLIALH